MYQSVALFLQKCVKTHLLASVTPQKIFRLANARHEARTLPPQYICQVYAYGHVMSYKLGLVGGGKFSLGVARASHCRL